MVQLVHAQLLRVTRKQDYCPVYSSGIENGSFDNRTVDTILYQNQSYKLVAKNTQAAISVTDNELFHMTS